MQMTIDIPDELARQLEPERKRLAEIIRRGLSELGMIEGGVGNCALAEEVLAFLARSLWTRPCRSAGRATRM